ncbi:MAG: DUF4314 domain-containing protein [Erysipelotrichaceae bacterium]
MTKVEELRKVYTKGQRIRLHEMKGESLPKQLTGSVSFVDDMGQIHMEWDNGSTLALNIEADDFEKIDGKQLIEVVSVLPGLKPCKHIIKNDLHSLQEMVGGCIEVIELEDEIDLICHEEGKLIGLKANRKIGHDIIAGPFLIVRNNLKGEFISLTVEQMNKYLRRFDAIETYTQEEVEACCWMDFINYE